MGSLHSRHRLARCSKPIAPLIGHSYIVQVIVAQARPCDQCGRTRTAARRARNKPAPGPVSHCADGAIQKRRGLFPTVEMEIHVKKFLLAILLIIGVAGCAPLTAQQKEAIDYQNHRPWSGG